MRTRRWEQAGIQVVSCGLFTGYRVPAEAITRREHTLFMIERGARRTMPTFGSLLALFYWLRSSMDPDSKSEYVGDHSFFCASKNEIGQNVRKDFPA